MLNWVICGSCGGRGFVEVFVPTVVSPSWHYTPTVTVPVRQTETRTCPQCNGAGGQMVNAGDIAW